MNNKRGKIITVSSFKGGVGKTITLLNLAGIYSKLGLKVLILDLDLESGGVSLCLNTKNIKNILTVVDDIANNRFKDYKDYVEKYNENIDLVNSLKDPRLANQIDSKYIELFLNHVSYKYDVILIDTTHGFSPVTVTAIDIAYNNLFIMTNDIMDIKTTKTTLAIIEDLGKDNSKLLLNLSSKSTNNYFSNYEIENLLKHKIDYIIPDYFHVKNINSYILEGTILTLNKKIKLDEKVLVKIAEDLIKER